MGYREMPTLRIGELEAKIPIIQGGMGVGVSLSGLASAVANEGGIGVIASAGIGMLEPDFQKNFRGANRRALRKEIKAARQKTKGIIGANIMMALSDFNELVLIAVDEGVDIIFVGAGLPLKMPGTFLTDSLTKTTTKIVPIVSSARAVKIIFEYWARNYHRVPDAVVVEGPLAGGHLGFKREQISDPDYRLEKILPEVISTVKPFEEQFITSVPVIAAGGIYSGEDIDKYLHLGARGVQMATRFVGTHECDASAEFKSMYLQCKKEDLIIIDSPVGLPGRAISNQFLQDVADGVRQPIKCPWKCLRTCEYKEAPYCIAYALTNAKLGNTWDGFCFAGANAHRVDKIVSVKELIATIMHEYQQVNAGNFPFTYSSKHNFVESGATVMA